MWTFNRQIKIETQDEAKMLLDLVVEEVPHMDQWEIAECFGCEFTCDDEGELIDPDYSPMIGLWHVHFEWTFSFGGDSKIMMVKAILPETQTMTEIHKEYTEARDYCKEWGGVLDSIQEYRGKLQDAPKEIFDKWIAMDMDMYKHMEKRRELATGDLNSYHDYTGMEGLKWLFK